MQIWAILVIGLLMAAAAPRGDRCDQFDCGTWDVRAPSQPPTPTPTKAREEPKQQTAPPEKNAADEHSGTDDVPFVIKIGPSPNAYPATDSERQERIEKASQEWWTLELTGATTIFTGLLFLVSVVQAGLFFWQLRLIRDELGHTKTAAEAAKTSADTAKRALRELERPWVFVSIHQGAFNESDAADREDVFVIFDIANHGRFPADIKECHAGISITKTNAPDGPFIQDQWHGVIGPNHAMTKGKVFFPQSERRFRVVVFESEVWRIPELKPTEDLFFYICIRYAGAGADLFVSDFCWRWDNGISLWVRFNDDRYNRRT